MTYVNECNGCSNVTCGDLPPVDAPCESRFTGVSLDDLIAHAQKELDAITEPLTYPDAIRVVVAYNMVTVRLMQMLRETHRTHILGNADRDDCEHEVPNPGA